MAGISQDPRDVSARLELALELFDAAIEMLRTRLRREQPGITEAAVEARVNEWLMTRPGAEYGDADGHPVPWPRRRP